MRLFIYGSCLCALLLLIAQLGAQIYLRAHARRLLGAMPTKPPAPLLIAHSGNNTLIRPHTDHHLAATCTNSAAALAGRSPVVDQANGGPPTATPTYTSTTSDGYSAALAAATAAAAKSKGGVDGSEGDDDEQATIDSTTNFNYGPDYADYTMTNVWKDVNRHDHRSSSPSSTNHKADSYCYNISLKVPINILIQMIAVQLLIVVLVESQSPLGSWRKQQQPTNTWRHHYSHQPSAARLNGGLFQIDEPTEALNPIGAITYTLVWALIYLQATLAFWLLDQFIQLALMATAASRGLSCNKQQRQQRHTQANDWHEPRPLFGPTPSHPDCNVYGSATQQQQQQIAISPASSSSYGALTTSASSSQQQQQQQQQSAIYLCRNGQVNPARGYVSTTNSKRPMICKTSSLVVYLSAVCRSEAFRWILVHAMPAIASTTIVWFASERGALWLNSSAYTLNGYLAQLAYWSLLLDASMGPLGALLYSLPTVSSDRWISYLIRCANR